jgi:hypothetical protein
MPRLRSGTAGAHRQPVSAMSLMRGQGNGLPSWTCATSPETGRMRQIGISYVKPSALKAADYNPRMMTDKARAALKRGIETFGLVDPIIARKSDHLVIGGHQRLHAAQELGLATVPVVYVDVDDRQAAALNVLLNNPSAQGEWDFSKLSGLLSDLDANGFDATLTGFDDEELARMLGHVPDVEFREFGEDTADDVKYVDCPKCGHRFPK